MADRCASCPVSNVEMLAVLATEQHDGSISQISLLAEPEQDLEECADVVLADPRT